MQNFDTLRKLANSLNQFAEANEKISLAKLNLKLAEANFTYPEDQTIGVLRGVISKIASRKAEISRLELKDIYEKLNSGNSKFAQIFSEELGVEAIPEIKPELPQEAKPFEFLDLDSVREDMVDPVFAAALDQAFGGTRAPYNASLAKRATEVVADRFDLFNLKAKYEIAAGSGHNFVCRASFQTPRGTTSVFVPVIFDETKTAVAEMFVGNKTSGEITRSNVLNYLSKSAGEKLEINPSQVLDILMNSDSNEVSAVDLAVIKLKQDNTPENYFSPGIVGQTIEPVNPNLVLNLEVEQAPEWKDLSNQLSNALSSACYLHGSKVVQAGRNNIENKLREFGISSISTAVSANDQNSITYDVSINGGNSAFRVPVVVANKVPMLPEIMICQGSIKEFNREGLQELLSSKIFDARAAMTASPLYGTRPSDLVAIIRKAMDQKNFTMAEDALNILSEGEDPKAYAAGLEAFSLGLKDKEVGAVAATCGRQVMHKHSQHPICAHTNLPVQKTYVDKQGNCRPLHRRASEDSSDGSSEIDKNLLFGVK